MVTYRLWTQNDTIRPDLDKYLSGLWVQRKDKNEGQIYKGGKCEDMYDPFNQSPQFMSQIKGQTCAIMEGNNVQLQRANNMDNTTTEHDFFFVLDFCNHFKNYTGVKDCKTVDETVEVLNQIRVEFKVAHQFWNVATFVMNGHEMQTVFETQQLVLNKEVFQRQSYHVARESISLYNSYIVNWGW